MSKHSKSKKRRKMQDNYQTKIPNGVHIIYVREIVPKLFEFFGKGILVWIPMLPPIYTTHPEPNSSDEVLLNKYNPLTEFILSTPLVDPVKPRNHAEVLLSTPFITEINSMESDRGSLRLVSYVPKDEFLIESNLNHFLYKT